MSVVRFGPAYTVNFRPCNQHEGESGGFRASLRRCLVLRGELFPQLSTLLCRPAILIGGGRRCFPSLRSCSLEFSIWSIA